MNHKATILATIILLAGFVIIPCGLRAQDKRVKISLQSGYSNAGNDYKNLDKGYNAGLDVSFRVYKNLFATLHYKFEEGRYYEDNPYVTDEPDYSLIGGDENAKLFVENWGVMVGYSYPVIPKLSISAQAGFTFFKEIKSSLPYRAANGYVTGKDKAMLSAAIPLKLSVDYEILSFLAIGLASGFYIEPDFNDAIRGFYVGPQISFLF